MIGSGWSVRAVRGVTGLSESTILKAIESGRIDGTSGLFGNWKIEYKEPRQTYFSPAKNAPENAAQASVAPDASILEAEIAALVAEAGESLRHPDNGRTAPAFYPLAADPNDAGQSSVTPANDIDFRVNEPVPERHSWDPDIRIDDPERAAKAVPSPRAPSAQRTSTLLAALLGALTTGWVLGVISVSQQKVGFSGQAPGPKDQIAFGGPETSRPTAPSVPDTGKIAASAPNEHGHRPGYTKSAARQPGAVKPSAVAPLTTRPSEATASIGRRSDLLPDPMPFPETKPTTIEGWIVRDVSGGTAVLEGPDGAWRAARGDTVPHVGTVESIVRWGDRWIVVTSSGLISTP
jgi:hypothetical protein